MVNGECPTEYPHVESGVQSIQGSIEWEQASTEERRLLPFSAECLQRLRAKQDAQSTLPAS